MDSSRTLLRPIERQPLRELVQRSLMDAVLAGELAAGQRINETEIAARLGLSQTPVREALGALEERGFLVSRPRRGFFVRELARREGVEVYSLLGDLEALALKQAEAPDATALGTLRALNDELDSLSDDPLRAIELDGAFHRELHARCANRLLRELLERVRQKAFRYEVAYMREVGRPEAAARQHRDILEALAAGDRDRACRAVRENWRAGIAPLESWLGDESEDGGE